MTIKINTPFIHKKVFTLLVWLIPALFATTLLSSCVDDTFDFYGDFEGDANLNLDLVFRDLHATELGTRASAGNSIEDIDNVWVGFYGEDGQLRESRYFQSDDMTVTDVDRTDVSDSENTPTRHARMNTTVATGKYYIYTAVNAGNLSGTKDVSTTEKFRKCSFKWDNDSITANRYMAGFFNVKGSNVLPTEDATTPLVSISKASLELQAWVRRLASKVTVSFDASKLRENIYIYIKSIQVKDIATSCQLIDSIPGEDIEVSENGETLDCTLNSAQLASVNHYDDNQRYPEITSGKNEYTSLFNPNPHAKVAPSLFFFENCQGTGPEKYQVKSNASDKTKPTYPDGVNATDPWWQDTMDRGSYVEVKAYYISNAPGNEGKGEITYRFMLGKDIHKNYSCERNTHFKLTMQFRGNANDVDWHIAYVEEPGIYVPSPYYISYLYNSSMELPVKIAGNVTSLQAEIIENNWAPYYEPGVTDNLEWWQGEVRSTSSSGTKITSAADRGKDIWNGFLSLWLTTGTEIGSGLKWGSGKGNYDLWLEGGNSSNNLRKGLGGREYPTLTAGTHDTEANGQYRVVKNADQSTSYYLPMFTRQLLLVGATGFTGNNVFVSHMRKAVVRITATINGVSQSKDVTIYQVRRLINPKGVYREPNNTTPFHVVLMRSPDENADSFEPFESDGPWSAEIESGSGWKIGTNTASMGTSKINGKTGTNIDFYVAPATGYSASSSEVNCAIVKVRYHNYTCEHKIALRQGGAPIAIVNGGAKWHTRNMWYSTSETACPLEEGSLFRYGNTATAIDAIANQEGQLYKTASTLAVARSGITATNALEGAIKWADLAFDKTNGFQKFKPTINGVACRVPSYDDFNLLKTNCELGFGIMYGNDATSTKTKKNLAYNHAWYNTDEGAGMRGCFVYNAANGRNLFFPIGAAGNGRRKHGHDEGDKRGTLRYANRGALYTTDGQIEFRPLFRAIYTNWGAIYWISNISNTSTDTAWDFNFTTFDFNGFGQNATNLSSSDRTTNPDAAFIRLVE